MNTRGMSPSPPTRLLSTPQESAEGDKDGEVGKVVDGSEATARPQACVYPKRDSLRTATLMVRHVRDRGLSVVDIATCCNTWCAKALVV